MVASDGGQTTPSLVMHVIAAHELGDEIARIYTDEVCEALMEAFASISVSGTDIIHGMSPYLCLSPRVTKTSLQA